MTQKSPPRKFTHNRQSAKAKIYKGGLCYESLQKTHGYAGLRRGSCSGIIHCCHPGADRWKCIFQESHPSVLVIYGRAGCCRICPDHTVSCRSGMPQGRAGQFKPGFQPSSKTSPETIDACQYRSVHLLHWRSLPLRNGQGPDPDGQWQTHLRIKLAGMDLLVLRADRRCVHDPAFC